ncbi:MAG: DinB family protein [Bacteroidetes bacterium]|nr:DinB family protein [Bacteroidota bacterium]
MAIFSRSALVTELLDRTELIKTSSQLFLRLSDEQLQYKPAPEQWSIAEIYGHLNIAHDWYIRCILSRVTLAPDWNSDEYISSWLGEWMYDKIMPRPDGSVFKIKALKAHYAGAVDGREELESFLRKCDAMDDILRHASGKNLRRIKIPVHFLGVLKVRLGDTLRILVAHGERHLLQAQRVLVTVA